MKRLGTFWGIALALVLGVSGLLASSPAHAQVDTGGTPELSQDWAVRIGIWIAQSSSVRDKVGDVGISGRVERRVYSGKQFDILAGIGYNGLDTVYSVPITIDMVFFKDNLRYGFGTGYAFGKRLDGQGTSGAVISLRVGYQLTHTTNPLSVDLRYMFISGSSNELDGYSLTIGYQF